jgi:HSP20 family protein
MPRSFARNQIARRAAHDTGAAINHDGGSSMAKSDKDVTVSKGTLERMPRRSLFGDVDRMFDDFINRRWARPFGELAESLPSVDVIDRDDEVVVRAEVPGYKKEEIEVSVSNSTLTLKGETKSEEKEETGDYYRCEISRGSFTRTIALPAAVDEAKARASMKDGMLELTLPKLEKAKRHTISIS